MPKTITFSDIKIKEVSLSGNNTISVVFCLLTENGEEWVSKRIRVKDLTFTQKTAVQKIFTFLTNKIKQLEGI